MRVRTNMSEKSNTITDELLKNLIADSDEYRKTALPQSEKEKKTLIRSLMNIRIPKEPSEELLKTQDAYLQRELQSRKIVKLSDLKSVKEELKSENPCADRIFLWQGDITCLAVSAIVNAANSTLLGCFVPGHNCIDNAIHSFAGIQLRQECFAVMKAKKIRFGENYAEPPGGAALTKGYNLPCDYVIHTVGPIVRELLTDKNREDLKNCYESVLSCCAENSIESVALCCISTGVFGFPNGEAALIAVKTVTDFLQKNPDSAPKYVVFNVFKDQDKVLYKKILAPKK